MAYWALKTRESRNSRQDMSENYWGRFVSDKVIAIGWKKLGVLPDKASYNELFNALKKRYNYSDRQASMAADVIQKFVNLAKGDGVLICQGYSPNQIKDVILYGVAQVIGPFENNSGSSWWHYQHKAKIQPFGKEERKISKKSLAKKLSKGSLLLTLHEISKEGFESVVEWAKH